ncbi:hypothetical protein [Spiroplasma endosymbiont of Polydrusus cervinus]|uniref:hypothetical protein n=1 Tax=Spiroplasma endosymbiont of Polydrusus cervinus TaxID=3066287 RepID=UPI0030CD4E50
MYTIYYKIKICIGCSLIHNKNYKSHNEYINDVKKWNKWYSNQKEKYIINESL